MSAQNLSLWESVKTTDPQYTKQFSRSGGFKGTAISPMYLIWKATQKFGPIGIGWGFSEVENKFIEGIWCSKVRLWYDFEGKRGEAEQWGQTVMVGTNKNGSFVDEEAPKKAVTDGVTKCLSYLGFASDVHMGRYDDNKYVAELHQKKRAGQIDTEDAPEDCKPDAEKREVIKSQKLAEAAAAGSKYVTQLDKPAAVSKVPTFEQMMEVFSQLRGDFKFYDAEPDYYEVLNNHGFSHANEAVKAGVQKAREVKTDMQLRLQQLMKSNQAGTLTPAIDNTVGGPNYSR